MLNNETISFKPFPKKYQPLQRGLNPLFLDQYP